MLDPLWHAEPADLTRVKRLLSSFMKIVFLVGKESESKRFWIASELPEILPRAVVFICESRMVSMNCCLRRTNRLPRLWMVNPCRA
jgi:hypothetical protein